MIGDSWNSDIQGAAQYGIDTCWYNPERQPRPASPEITHEIAALEELPSWLGIESNKLQ
jgi:2-haloacid dehalogenase